MRMLPFVLLVSVVMLAGCIQQKDCRVSSDCDNKVHPNCSSDWMCVDGKCVWDCGGCSLSLCDCKCHPTGQTPEELTGQVCGINCQKEFNVSGCQYRGGACAELYVAPEENVTIANPASVYCVDKGFRSEIRYASDGSQYGVCILSNGLECEEWSLYHGNCVISSVSPCDNNIVENISGWKGVKFVGGIDRITLRQNLSYVCCANVSVSLSKNGSVLRIYENNVGKVCRCICGYYLNITVPELSAGTYQVEVYGVSFEETEGTLLANATVSVGAADKCVSDDDCVPEQCCHPTSCINKDSKGVCNMMCTQECRAGSLDCGQGRCVCDKGKCDVEWAQLETE